MTARRHRPVVWAATGAFAMAWALAACGGGGGGTSLGELRTAAKRVVGGGAECPVDLDLAGAMRAVGYDGVVLPDQRNPGHASSAVIGPEDEASASTPGHDSVRLVCRFLAGPQRVTVVVTGVGEGHAMAGLVGDIQVLGHVSPADAATFVSMMSDRRPVEARAVPGDARVAVARVETSDGSDQAVLVGVEALDSPAPTAAPPAAAEGTPSTSPPPTTTVALLSAGDTADLAARVAHSLAH